MASLKYIRHDLWSRAHDIQYDASLLGLDWLTKFSLPSEIDEPSSSQKKNQRSVTKHTKNRFGESLIYLSVSTSLSASYNIYHHRIIRHIMEGFNISSPTAHLVDRLREYSFLGHKRYCVEVTDEMGLALALHQIEEEQRTIDAMNEKYCRGEEQSNDDRISRNCFFQPIQFLVLTKLEAILFSEGPNEKQEEWIKNLNFLFKNSDSSPAFDNLIVLLTVDHPPPQADRSTTLINSLPDLKAYYASLLNKGSIFNGDAFMGRISRYAVEDPQRLPTLAPPSHYQSICDLFHSSEFPSAIPLSSKNIPEYDAVFQQALDGSKGMPHSVFAVNSWDHYLFTGLATILLFALFLIYRNRSKTRSDRITDDMKVILNADQAENREILLADMNQDKAVIVNGADDHSTSMNSPFQPQTPAPKGIDSVAGIYREGIYQHNSSDEPQVLQFGSPEAHKSTVMELRSGKKYVPFSAGSSSASVDSTSRRKRKSRK